MLMMYYLSQSIQIHKDYNENITEEEFKQTVTGRDFNRLLYRGVATFRKILQNIGDRMAKEHIFHDSKDVFFVTYEELASLLSAARLPADYQRMLNLLIQDRRRSYAMWNQLFAPQNLPCGELPKRNPREFKGKTVLASKMEGIARIIRKSSDLPSLQEGDILVTTSIDELWVPFLDIPGGIIVENKEVPPQIIQILDKKGTPLLTQVKDATRLIHDGIRLSLNEKEDYIRVLET